ncbi:hypothetical protein BRC81_17040 [Halobacteriales archaeon QS_1_68_20]|nr:MAG: hypothetical protein BRC81_17040 [Halobacteriales archaeon QS_1_68_20]
MTEATGSAVLHCPSIRTMKLRQGRLSADQESTRRLNRAAAPARAATAAATPNPGAEVGVSEAVRPVVPDGVSVVVGVSVGVRICSVN